MKKYFTKRLLGFILFCYVGFTAPVYGQASFDNHKISEEIRSLLEDQSYFIRAPYPSNWETWTTAQLEEFISDRDPWSSLGFVSPEQLNALAIGAKLYSNAGKFWLLPYEDGALMHKGVSSTVQLISIDGQNINGLTLSDVAAKLQERKGQSINLEVCEVHNNCSTTRQILVSRQTYRVQTVEKIRLGKHDVIRILSFDENTPMLLRQLITSSKEPSLNPNLRPVIIDLRENDGGNLFAAVKILGFFLKPEDEIVSVLDKKGQYTHFYSQNNDKLSHKFPLLLLVSKRTASSGEIFAGVLKHYGIAIIIGERTSGKCVSQTERKLSDGRTFKFTNIEVLLPGNTRCEKIGIQPQKIVEREKILNDLYLSKILDKFIQRESNL